MVLLFFIQQKVPRGCPRKNVFFRIRNISKRKQASGKKHAEHCLRHLNKTACEIWSVFDKVLFCVKYLLPFFHRTLQLSDLQIVFTVTIYIAIERFHWRKLIIIMLHIDNSINIKRFITQTIVKQWNQIKRQFSQRRCVTKPEESLLWT